jgi:quercetin dioxygenase-like cupin family protein
VTHSLAKVGLSVLLQAQLCSFAAAQAADAVSEGADQNISRASSRRSVLGPSEHFTGQVAVAPAWRRDDGINAAGAIVHFDAGAHSAWHTHPTGQRLLILSGHGLTQEWGKSLQHLAPGDIVYCAPGVKHWHGAAPNSPMSHLAVTGSVGGTNVSWMEKVTDDQYTGQ